MAISLGSIEILPLAVQMDPGIARVRLFVCQTAWEATELESKRFTLRAGHLDFHALPFKIRLEPFLPVTIRVDFPIRSVSSPLLLRCTRGLFLRTETIDLLEHPLVHQDERADLRAACRAAWLERAVGLERGFDPKRFRQSFMQLDTASLLLERYLHYDPENEEALLSKRRLQLKKSLIQHVEMGNWLRVRRISKQIEALQPEWPGIQPPQKPALEQAKASLLGGWLEIAEEQLEEAIQAGASKADASLLLARMNSAWKRAPEAAARRYVDYFRFKGLNEVVVAEALDVIDSLEKDERLAVRGELLSALTERLVTAPEDFDLANLVYEIAEHQSAEGVANEDDLALLWACYEKAFEHQVAVDRRVERMLVRRLESLHDKLGNVEDWLRIRRQLATLEPENTSYRLKLGAVLRSAGKMDEALHSDFSLWVDAPDDEALTRQVARIAVEAGNVELAERAEAWRTLMSGNPLKGRLRFPGAPLRLVLHPDLRPLFPILETWQASPEQENGIEEVLVRLADANDALPIDHWRELESAAKQLPLIPSMEASLSLREPTELDPLHPLRVAGRVSLDRLALSKAESFMRGLEGLGSPLFSEGRLQLQSDDPLTRYRALEVGRFLLGPLWESIEHQALLPEEPLADFLESMLRSGLPDMTTRAYFEDVRKSRKMSRRDWKQLETRVLAYLRLAPASQVDETLM